MKVPSRDLAFSLYYMQSYRNYRKVIIARGRLKSLPDCCIHVYVKASYILPINSNLKKALSGGQKERDPQRAMKLNRDSNPSIF